MEKVTRLEIIDHTPCSKCDGKGIISAEICSICSGVGMMGRQVIFWDNTKQIELSLQDDDRTLKIFISERDGEENTTNQ